MWDADKNCMWCLSCCMDVAMSYYNATRFTNAAWKWKELIERVR